MKVNVLTASGVTPSEAKICICAVHEPVCADEGISSCENSVLGLVLMLAGLLVMVKTDRSGCWKVILQTVLPAPTVVSSMKVTFTDAPRANVVVAAPLGFVV